MNQDRYSLRGVSSTKDEVHAVVDKMSKGLFPGAFCKINPDFLTGNPDKCCVIHSDGSGTKSTLAYLHFKETGDPSAFRKTAQDSMVMNIDDLICIGVTDNILISSTINRNARNIPGPVLAELISGTESFLQSLRDNDILIHSGGGETADVGDLTPTVTVDSCAVACHGSRASYR
jgi:phosphoribosylformylglycinamidine cyclo-ligase